MTESIFTFAPRRLAELEQELLRARRYVSALEHEITMLTPLVAEIEAATGAEGFPRDFDPPNHDGMSGAGGVGVAREPETYSPETTGEKLTIKKKSLVVLGEHPTGLTNAQVQQAIEKKYGVRVEAKSLSPQLNRLRVAGELRKDGGLWKLGTKR